MNMDEDMVQSLLSVWAKEEEAVKSRLHALAIRLEVALERVPANDIPRDGSGKAPHRRKGVLTQRRSTICCRASA